MEKIGWIGVGTLGGAIVNRLLDLNIRPVVFNRTQDKLQRVKARGATVATSPREVAEASSTVFICLSAESAARTVLFDKTTGIVAAESRTFSVVDLSTIGPKLAIEFHDTLSTMGIQYIECPVSGGPEGGAAGRLTAVVSGDNEIVNQHREIISKFASSIHFVGEPGKAQALKLVNNLAESINLWGAAEAISLGLRSGISLTDMRKVLQTMRGYSPYMGLLFERLENPVERTSVSLGVRVKDLRLARSMALTYQHEVPLGTIVEQLFQEVMDQEGEFADQTKCISPFLKRSPTDTFGRIAQEFPLDAAKKEPNS